MIIDNPHPEHIPVLRSIWKQAFGDSDAFLDAFFDRGFSCDRCRCVFREGEPVAAIYLFDGQWEQKPVAYLYALAVEQAHRGQGLSRLLLAQVHGALQQAGYAGTVLEPASQSLAAYYATFGYRFFGGRQEITACAGETPAEVTQYGKLGYEQARRRFLPEGGVTQEGALTVFLQTQAMLCGNEQFVAAVDVENETVVEFLGDTNQLPGLLRHLKLEQASVRLPGGAPASMYLSFSGEPQLPAYFGLPLD